MSMRFHTAMTVRGRRYLDAATSTSKSSATMTARILVSVAPLIDATVIPPLPPPTLGSVGSPRNLGVATTPGGPRGIALGSQFASRRHGLIPVRPRWMGRYTPRSSAVGSNGIQP